MTPLSLVRMLALVVAGAPANHAGTAVEANFFDELARRAYTKHAYSEALDAFLLVSDIAPSAGAVYNVAVAAELAGKPDVAYAYYREYLARLDPDAERRADAERRLAELCRSLALVEVTSEPPGAAVYVDRRELGSYGTTPRSLALAPGAHELSFELEGHEAAHASVTASLGATQGITVLLPARVGELAVQTEPPGAEVELFREGERIEASAVNGAYRLPVGSYVLRIHPQGHVTAEARVRVTDGAPSRVTLVALPLPLPTGRLLVSTGGVAAAVAIDGQATAVTPLSLSKVAAGEHTLDLSARGFVSVRRRVVVRAGRATYLEVALSPLPARAP